MRQHSTRDGRPSLIFMYAGYLWQSGHREERKQMAGALTHPLATSLPFTLLTGNTITAYVNKINLLICLIKDLGTTKMHSRCLLHQEN